MPNAVGIVGHSSESFSFSMDNAIVRKLKFETGRIVHGNTKRKSDAIEKKFLQKCKSGFVFRKERKLFESLF